MCRELLINRAETGEGEEEQIVWQGRPFLSIFDYYTITTERLRVVHGFLGKDHENIGLVRLNDLDWDHGVGARPGIGAIIVTTAASETQPRIVLRNVSDPAKGTKIFCRAMLDAPQAASYYLRTGVVGNVPRDTCCVMHGRVDQGF